MVATLGHWALFVFHWHCWLAPHHHHDCWASVLPCCSLNALHFGRWWLSLRQHPHCCPTPLLGRLGRLGRLDRHLRHLRQCPGDCYGLVVLPRGHAVGLDHHHPHPHYRYHHHCHRLPPWDGRWNHPHHHHRGQLVDCGFDLQKEVLCSVPMFLTGHSVYPINHLIGHRETCPMSTI